jgi:hypothetical protein
MFELESHHSYTPSILLPKITHAATRLCMRSMIAPAEALSYCMASPNT